MRTFVVVNCIQEVGFRQTTALLMAALVRQGCDVVVASVEGLSTRSIDDRFRSFITGVALPRSCRDSVQVADSLASSRALETFAIDADDLLLIRTNPGRDQDRKPTHDSFLHSAEMLQSTGTRVINAPGHLSYFASKASLLLIDQTFRPEMIVTSQTKLLLDFVRHAPTDCVIKPLHGSRGENVIRVHGDDQQLERTVASTFDGQNVVAQHFVAAVHPGDRRVVVLDGKVLEHDNHIAGIERHPAENDFRCNLHTGGSAHPLKLNGREREAVDHAAKLLQKHGIRLAGVDLIGDQIIELNVFSTGGLFDGNRFAGFDFTESIARRFLNVDW